MDSEQSQFKELPLHDAPLRRSDVLWEEKVCRFYLSAFLIVGQRAVPHVLEFSEVTELLIPHSEPWGPSVFVNSAAEPEVGRYEIEMQSGDVIQIAARGFTFMRSNKSLQPTPAMEPNGQPDSSGTAGAAERRR